MKASNIALLLVITCLTARGQAPSGNDNQGGVSSPAGTYYAMPNANGLNAYTGNVTRVVDDLSETSISPVGLNWTRYNNTRATGGTQYFGVGGNWRHSFQWDFSLTTINSTPAIQVIYPNGTTNIFTQTSPNIWTSTSAVTDVITPSGSNYLLTSTNNTIYTFSTVGGIYRLTSITDSSSRVTTLTYSSYSLNGSTVYALSKVTEPGGRYLTITNANDQIENIQVATYQTNACGGSGNTTYTNTPTYALAITKVTTSDGRTASYAYTADSNSTAVTTSPNNGATQVTTTTTYYQNCLSTASYSDGLAATYTYTQLTTNGIPVISQANDTRAVGTANIKYSYFSGTGIAVGTVQTITEGSTSSTVVTASLQSGNSQAPQVTYPDSSLYNYSVNAGGLLASVTNSLSAIKSFGYSSTSGTWTTSTTNANGNTVSSTTAATGQVLSRSFPKVGSETYFPTESWTYNSAGYMTSYTDTLGHTVTFTRDPTTNLVMEITYPDSTTEGFTYNSFSEVLTHTRRNGGIEYFTYSSTGLLQAEKDADGYTTKFSYDSNNRIASITDANNYTTSFLYNDAGKTTKITHPNNSYQSFTYSNAGYLLTKTDELGHTTTYTYDAFGRVLTAKDPLNRTTTYTYAANSPTNASPTLITLPSGKKVSASYVAAWGYKASQITTAYGTANAASTNYGYDALGNLTSITDPLSHATSFTYDARNRKATAEDPAGDEAYFYYDDAGNLITQITPAGTSALEYDSMNRLSQMNDAKNQVTHYYYDSEGKLKKYTDPNGQNYIYSYDLDEHRLSMLYPDSTTQTWAYDPVGNLITADTRDSRIETLAYDSQNRNTGSSWNDSVTPSVTIGYDNASRITSLSNANSALSYTFDNANEVLSEVQNVTGLGSKTVSYTYTVDGILNTLTNPDGTVLTYAYDYNNNLTSIQQSGTSVVSYAYDANNNRAGKNLANGVTSTLTYDSVERLTSITDLTPSPSSGTLLQKFQYGYDSMSRRTYVKRDNALGDVYTYDAASQLTNVEYNCTNPDTSPTSPSQTVSYTYDAAGNRTQVADSSNGTTNYTANSTNQYTAVGSNSATYDGRGNLATYNGTTYTYDANNALIQATDSLSNVTTQAYDPLGRCVKRVLNGVASYFVYDLGWRLIADYSSSASQVSRYVCGPAANEIITKTDNSGNVVYYHTDGLGSVTKLTNSTGALIEKYIYDAFGQTTIENAAGTILSTSAYANRFLYGGSELVTQLALYYMKSRFYSPTLGRFLQPDPIGYSGDGYNIYRYCGNNPINATDPWGTANMNAVLTGSQQFIEGAAALTILTTAGIGTGPFSLVTFSLEAIAFSGAVGLLLEGLGNISNGLQNGLPYANAQEATFNPAGDAAGLSVELLGTLGLGGTPAQAMQAAEMAATADEYVDLYGSAADFMKEQSIANLVTLEFSLFDHVSNESSSDGPSATSPQEILVDAVTGEIVAGNSSWLQSAQQNAPYAWGFDVSTGNPIPQTAAGGNWIPFPYAGGVDGQGFPIAQPFDPEARG